MSARSIPARVEVQPGLRQLILTQRPQNESTSFEDADHDHAASVDVLIIIAADRHPCLERDERSTSTTSGYR